MFGGIGMIESDDLWVIGEAWFLHCIGHGASRLTRKFHLGGS